MTDLKTLNNGAQMPSESDPMTFKRPNMMDATRSTINETSYNPSEPHLPSRFEEEFNKPVGESDGTETGNIAYDRISGQLATSHQR